MRIKKLVTVIGMTAVLLIVSKAETIPGCGCSTEGFSPTTGESCAGNTPGLGPIPSQLKIGDATVIQAQAWERVSQIEMFGRASSAIHSSENIISHVRVQYVPTSGVVDVEEIFSNIRAQQLLLSVLYPSDTIELEVRLTDIEGGLLFYDLAEGGINPPRNGVSKNTLDVVFKMYSEILIPFSGAERFEIVERDENKNPILYYPSEDSDIENGSIRFPVYFAKKGGEIKITLCDGTEVSYALNGGSSIIPTSVRMGIRNVSALGTRTFRNSNLASLEVSPEEFDNNINPLSQFEVSTLPWNFMIAWINNPRTGQREYASAVSYWLQGEPEQRVEADGQTHYARAYIQYTGLYWVKFEFPSGWPGTKNQFSRPATNGGGGGGSSIPVPVIEEK